MRTRKSEVLEALAILSASTQITPEKQPVQPVLHIADKHLPNAPEMDTPRIEHLSGGESDSQTTSPTDIDSLRRRINEVFDAAA